MYTTRWKAWPVTLGDPCLLSGDDISFNLANNFWLIYDEDRVGMGRGGEGTRGAPFPPNPPRPSPGFLRY